MEDALGAAAAMMEATTISIYDEAMAAHAERLASLDPSSPDVAGLRSRSRRGARLREEREERERAEGTGGGLLPSVPRKVPARFENRGKSGAVF